MNEKRIYSTVFVRIICKKAKIPNPIASKINEFIEILERKYMNGDKSLSYWKQNDILESSFPCTNAQYIDLANRLNINLVLESGIKGFTCLFQDYYIFKLKSFGNGYYLLIRDLIESPYLKSTTVLTFLKNKMILYHHPFPIDEIYYVGSIKAYLWLVEHYKYNIKHSFAKVINPYQYLLTGILKNGTLSDFLFFNMSIKKISDRDCEDLLSLLNSEYWAIKIRWNEIRFVTITIWLLEKLYEQTTIDLFTDCLRRIIITYHSFHETPKHYYKEHVILSFFNLIKDKFNTIFQQPDIIDIITSFSTTFFLRFWLFENYQIPLSDPFDEIKNLNLSYAYDYFQYYCTDEKLQMNYSNQYRLQITKEIIYKCVSLPYVTSKELDWFVEFFQLQFLLCSIDALEAVCSNVHFLTQYDHFDNDIYYKRYKWLIQNGAYKSDNLSITFINQEIYLTIDDFGKILEYAGFICNQDLVNSLSIPCPITNQINYKLLFMIVAICWTRGGVETCLPDTFCYDPLIENDELFDTLIKSIAFLKFPCTRKLNRREMMLFINRPNAFTESNMIYLIDSNLLKECKNENNDKINSSIESYNHFLCLCQLNELETRENNDIQNKKQKQ